MLRSAKKNVYKKIALVLSLCLIVAWALLGTGASLAWFKDTSPAVNNIFHFANFDLEVSYRLENGDYATVTAETELFDKNALYEPGYTQVVFLKVENKGTVPFDFQTAVNVTNYTTALNVLGHTFNLQDYLRFGVISANTETELEELVADRTLANNIAKMKLNNYSTDTAELAANGTVYMALIVRMTEEVGNDANYREATIPKVELGIIVSATQKNPN
ncbi:MAG: hypothetical protein E7574_01385 [Ruminococcaceae bacterium]|nr:hypothetical protein [Oscillospiraceae bacterium]